MYRQTQGLSGMLHTLNSLATRQNRHHFEDDILKHISSMTKIWLKFVPMDPTDKSALP